jgi:hypothetical protein
MDLPMSHEVTPGPRIQHGLGPTLLWACFLGCSWTWVIGMFLPIMLLRDFGVAGYLAFAIPNVIGAAAMGTVLARPQVSWNLVQRHPTILRWFAAVTIAYHLYVVFWLFGAIWAALLCVLPWMVMGAVRRQTIGGWLPAISVGVAVVSWGCFSMAGNLDGAWLDVGFGARDVFASRLSTADLWLLAPGLAAGFALCPYLDPTFQRARYSTGPGTGKLAFLLGFGVVFASMIVFTLMYAGLLRRFIDYGDASFIDPPWRVLLGIHITLQIAFTLSAHSREFFTPNLAREGWTTDLLVFLLMLGVVGWGVAARSGDVMVAGITLGEVGYRAFLLVYGVVFPGYALICMLPTLRQRGGGHVSLRARHIVFGVACIAAYPMSVAGLILGHYEWLLGLYGALAAGWAAVQFLPARPAEKSADAAPTG